MKRGFDRTQRIADMIHKTLAQMLLEEMQDERLRFVSVMDVTVARDLSFAKVYVSMLEDDADKIAENIEILNRAAKSLRYQLAHKIKLRVVPELKFIYDETTAKGHHLSHLIDIAVKKSGE